MRTFNEYILKTFGRRIWRLPLSTGYPCPNRIDGKTGCTYCSEKSFLPRYLKEKNSLENQIERGIEFFGKRYKVDAFYGYFQENTGTYGDRSDLLTKYETVLSNSKMVGLIISTRPDYIDKEIIHHLKKINKIYNKEVWFELGLQSVNDETLIRINRGHNYETFKNTVELIKNETDFKITVHMIIGLPGESPELIKTGVQRLFNDNKIDGIKFRLLEIIENSEMEKDFLMNKKDFYQFNIDSYALLINGLLKIIPEETVIMRLINFKSLKNLNYKSKNEFLKKVKELQ